MYITDTLKESQSHNRLHKLMLNFLASLSSWTKSASVPFVVLVWYCFCTLRLWLYCLQWHSAAMLSKEAQGSSEVHHTPKRNVLD